MQYSLKFEWLQNGETHSHTLNIPDSIVLGRKEDCDIVLPDEKVSRKHAHIIGQGLDKGGGFILKNLSQSNKIYFKNPVGLQLGFEEQARLQTGYVFLIGTIEITITRIEEVADSVILQVTCSGCGKVVDGRLEDCPWCGTSLAFGQTVFRPDE